MSEPKPIKARPAFYAHIYTALQGFARELGYNLLIHGSMNRDMDLVAVPWSDEPKSHLELLQTFSKFLNGVEGGALVNDQFFTYEQEEQDILEKYYCFSRLPGGRSSYIINLNRGGKFNGYIDEQYYLDISITPLGTPQSEIDLLDLHNPWSLKDSLQKLVEAANILLHQKNYDGHGWEEISHCVTRGEEIINKINNFNSPKHG